MDTKKRVFTVTEQQAKRTLNKLLELIRSEDVTGETLLIINSRQGKAMEVSWQMRSKNIQ